MMKLLSALQEYSALFLSKKTPQYERDLVNTLNLSNKIIGIIGAKGVGKTTVLMQFMKRQALSPEEMLYISVEHPLMSSTTILEIAKDFAALGGKLLLLDEIHHQENFAQDLKTIWDFLEINVIFSGSSALHLDTADLSRRVLKYTLPTLSLREFIEIETQCRFEKISLDDMMAKHSQYAQKVIAEVKPLKYFKDYLEYGFYPFYLEDRKSTKIKLAEAINNTIEVDLLKIFRIDPKKIRNLKKLLTMLCVSVPYKPNMSSLAKSIEIDSKTLYSYLAALQSGKIIRMLALHSRGESIIRKPEKIYLDNPNIFMALCQSPDIGAIRESFFSAMIQNAPCHISASQKGDFLVNDEFVFEIGGRNKDFKQIKNLDNAFIVVDDMEVGNKNRIPLWLFGFLY